MPKVRRQRFFAAIVLMSLPVGRPCLAQVNERPLKLQIFTPEQEVPTLQERVNSWFNDGTRVSVAATTELSRARLFAVRSDEVRVWVVSVSPERAWVLFSSARSPDQPRYLLREVTLVSGLDELGLERLASVIHSAFLALREGLEGSARKELEKELASAGLLPPAAPAQLALGPAEPVPTRPLALPRSEAAPNHRPPLTVRPLLAAGYGLRLRGAEQLGHGPLAAAGVQLPGPLGAFDAFISAHWLFRSTFDAGSSLAASVQTTAFRAHVGLEPAISPQLVLQALLGAGAELARIDAQSSGDGGERAQPRAAGSQWRGALQLTLGLCWQTPQLDWALSVDATFLPQDVHYSLRAGSTEQRLRSPWPLQPGLALRARFRP